MTALLKTASCALSDTTEKGKLSRALEGERREVFQGIFASLMTKHNMNSGKYEASYFSKKHQVVFICKENPKERKVLALPKEEIEKVDSLERKIQIYVDRTKPKIHFSSPPPSIEESLQKLKKLCEGLGISFLELKKKVGKGLSIKDAITELREDLPEALRNTMKPRLDRESKNLLDARGITYDDLEKLNAFLRIECLPYTLLPRRKKEKLKDRVSQTVAALSVAATWARFIDTLQSWRKGASSYMKLGLSEVLNSLSFISSLWSLKGAYEDYQISIEKKDKEGGVDAFRTATRSGFSFSGATLALTSSALKQTHHTYASSLLDFISSRILDVASVLGLVIATQRAARSIRFLQNINQYWENDNLNEKEKILGVLGFLHEATHLSEKEMQEIGEKVRQGKGNKEQLCQEKLEQKIRKFHRRVGNKSYEILIKEDALSKLMKLQDPNLSKEEEALLLKEAHIVIDSIRAESRKKIVSYVALFFASLLSLITSVIGYVYGVTFAVHILKLIISFVWFVYMNYMAALYFKYRPSDGYDLASQKERYF